uniref:RING-type domain-containing protein n=1 Tax=Ciona savignyi TaxID=51511 RepID=H2Z0E4_CIOSA
MSTDVPTSSSDSMISRSSKSSIRSFLRSGGIKTYQNNSLLGANFAFDLYQSQSKFSAFGTTLHHIAVKLSSQTDCLSPVTVDILIDLIKDKMQGLLSKEKESLTNSNLINVEDLEAPVDDFMCPHCRELLYKPVTLLCGHSFCQLCLKSPDRPMTVCNVCNVTITEKQRTTYGNNVVLTAVFESWHKVEWKGRALTCEGIALLQNREYEKCIKKLTDAIELVPQSHSAYLNRAKAKFFLKQYESALKDATCAAIAAHKSPEAYFVKGEILVHLDYTEEALFYFTTCLILDPSREDAEKRTHDIVTNMITPHYKSSSPPLSNKRPHSGQS